VGRGEGGIGEELSVFVELASGLDESGIDEADEGEGGGICGAEDGGGVHEPIVLDGAGIEGAVAETAMLPAFVGGDGPGGVGTSTELSV